jgi:hypothetical protein
MDYFSSNEIRIRKAIETDRIQYGENSVNEGANHPVMKTAFITALHGKRCLYLAITVSPKYQHTMQRTLQRFSELY